jgi:hypothetical protein
MTRAAAAPACLIVFLLASIVGCGGVQVPEHNGYKGKKPHPWDKPKVLKLGKKSAAKADLTLDYARFKRAKWYAISIPGPGALTASIDVTPRSGGGGDEDSEEQDMDVGFEILDGTSWNVLASSNLETEDAHELKKKLEVKELPEGRYLIHLFLEGRLDSADIDLDVAFVRGSLPWKSDFPNQVAFADDLATIPPLDDTPEVVAKKKVTRIRTTRPKDKDKDDGGGGGGGGGGAVMAEISDTQPDPGGGTVITIGGGTADGLENGLKGSIKGVRNSSFRLTGCGPSTCRAKVKAPIDSVRGAAGVVIKLN